MKTGTRLLALPILAALLGLSSLARADIPDPLQWGLSPGDTYHIIFHTSTSTSESNDPDIEYYNDFVTDHAVNAGLDSYFDETVDWFCVGSTFDGTTGVHARDNAFISAPVYNMRGDLVATGFDDFWDGTHSRGVMYTEFGVGQFYRVHTGTLTTGYSSHSASHPKSMLGGPKYDAQSHQLYGGSYDSDAKWTESEYLYHINQGSFYALSSPITVLVPEPSSLVLVFVGAVATLAWAGWRRRGR